MAGATWRSSASFVFQSVLVYPHAERFTGPRGNEEADNWIDTRDFRVMRNLQAFPRAWVVHRARPMLATTGQSRWALSESMQEILYANDGIWNDAARRVHDPRNVAWVSPADVTELRRYLSGQTTRPSETVTVTYPSPQRAVLEVSLDSPGLVILADVYYPGWDLVIDGRPARVYRVNGLMRGAAVSAGPHRLVYTYAPRSFRLGRLVSIAGLTALLFLGLGCANGPSIPSWPRHRGRNRARGSTLRAECQRPRSHQRLKRLGRSGPAVSRPRAARIRSSTGRAAGSSDRLRCSLASSRTWNNSSLTSPSRRIYDHSPSISAPSGQVFFGNP